MKTCTENNCGLPVHGRNLCQIHYARWRKKNLEICKKKSPQDRFKQSCKFEQNGCWIWVGGYDINGRPSAYIAPPSKKMLAHRRSYELFVGPIPKGMNVLHDCPSGDDIRCVNPDHLWIGTQKENIHDSIEKGRFIRGEKQGLSKLTEIAVREIRSSKEVQSVLMKRYGISSAQVSRVRNRIDWRWLS